MYAIVVALVSPQQQTQKKQKALTLLVEFELKISKSTYNIMLKLKCK